MTFKLPIYLDYQATTPVDPRVLEEMMPYFNEKFGNPHSRSHSFGWEAEEGVEQARLHVANLINADAKEIIFTSGATEANNLALKGVASFYGDKKKHIVTLVTEHKCVLDTCRHLEQDGFEITYLPVQQNGLVDLNELRSSLREDTLLVSVMAVHNEIGVIQPIAEIGKICREKGVFFHTDAAQAFGKIPLDVREMNIDLMSISGHKIYGPKGVGALFVSRKPRVRIEAIINGGGQERGMRSGTLPTPLVVGLGAAAKYAGRDMKTDELRIKKLTDIMLNELLTIPSVYLNGDSTRRIPGNINMSFAAIEGESMIGAIKNLAVSSGSACTSASLEPSYVLRALGVDEELAHTSIRFGIGRFTTEEEVLYAVNCIKNAVTRLRELSPLWEMLQDGIDLRTVNWAAH
jgi:cysteine desulfurase